ncbi:MAG: helix-turn-helix domain-containing protein [Boseongicola sp. SB0676_bin_33]|nr:helix-turn-helix domain-containing protein [Boseongicola sp. SB0676_bin_33]
MNDERYHYLECGLDDVYLMNGFERFETARGISIAIKEIDKLHHAIGEHLCRHKKELSGKEIRFLRREMLMSQAMLAKLLDVTEQTVHRWETGKSRMPRASEWLIRLLYMNKVPSVRNRLRGIADLEDEIDRRQDMILKLKKTRQKRNSARRAPSPTQWELEAA